MHHEKTDEAALAAGCGGAWLGRLALAAKKAEMNEYRKAWIRMILIPVVIAVVLAVGACYPWVRELIRREYGPPRETVPGTEEVYEGVISDRAMSIVDWMLYDKAPFLAESRPYIGISFDTGGGSCFWIADVFDEPERANPGDRVRIETAEEKGTDLRVVTKITLLEKLSF